MASTGFQQNLTEATIASPDTRNLGGGRTPVPTSTAGDIAAGVVGLANLATKAIPIFIKISEDNTLAEFNQKLNNIISNDSATSSERSTRLKALIGAFTSESPHMAQKFNQAMVAFGIQNPHTTDSEAAAQIRKNETIAGSVGADPGWLASATQDEIAERGRGILAYRQRQAILKNEMDLSKAKKEVNDKGDSKSFNAYAIGLVQGGDLAGINALASSAVKAATTLKEQEALLGDARAGVQNLVTQMETDLRREANRLGWTSKVTEEGFKTLSTWRENMIGEKGVLSEGGLNLKQYELVSKAFDHLANIEAHEKAGAIKLIKNLFGADVLGVIAATETFQAGVMTNIADLFSKAAKEVLFSSEEKTDFDMSLERLQLIAKNKSEWQNITSAKGKKDKIIAFTKKLTDEYGVVDKKSKSFEDGIRSWSNIASNLAGMGITIVKLPANHASIVNTMSEDAFSANLDTYAKSGQSGSERWAKVIGNNTIKMGNISLRSTLLEIGTNDMVTYSLGQLRIGSIADVQRAVKGKGKDPGDKYDRTVERDRLAPLVAQANKAMDLTVKFKDYSPHLKKLNEHQIRDTMMHLVGQSAKQNYFKGRLSLAVPEARAAFVSLQDTKSEVFQEQLQTLKGKIQEKTKGVLDRRRIVLKHRSNEQDFNRFDL